MSLTAHIKTMWNDMARVGNYGSEFLDRLFLIHPATKTYFANYDLTPSPADIQAQGEKIRDALTQAVNHLDDVSGTFSALSDLHATKLLVDPVNFDKRHPGE